MLKIGIIGIKGLPAKYGADLVVQNLIDVLRKDGHKIYVYGDEFGDDEFLKDYNLIKVKSFKGKYLRPLTTYLFSAFHCLKKGKYDVVHLHNLENSFILPLIKGKFPIVATSHGMAYRREKWPFLAKKIMEFFDILAFKYSDIVTSVSENLAKYYKSKYKKKCVYIPNGISPITEINIEEAHKILSSLNLKKYEYISFAAGRIIPSKGCHYLLEACKKLKEKSSLGNLKVLVIGDMQHMLGYSNSLKSILPNDTIFYPLITDKKVLYGLLKLSKIFVFPSTYEAMSMMLLETLMLEIPLVCSDIPENIEIIKESEIFFKSGDISDLSRKLIWGIKNSKKLISIIKKEKERIVKEKDWGRIKDLYLDVYTDAIKKYKRKKSFK